MSNDGSGLTDDPQDYRIEEAPTEASTLFARVIFVAGSIAIVATCWFFSNALFRLTFGVIGDGGGGSGLGRLFFAVFYWVINAVLAVSAWVSVWMIGVMLITTWHRYVRAPRYASE